MNKPQYAWLQVSIEADAELAEAVAEVLRRYVETGVVIESTQVEEKADGQGMVTGPLRVSAYIPADEELEKTREFYKLLAKRSEEAKEHPEILVPLE